MNIYILLRLIFYSLLAVTNCLALTTAAWSISTSKGQGQPQASPGAVLVIVGGVAFIVLAVMTWAESCVPRPLVSRVRTELALVPMLILFQLIGASVATGNTVESVCHDPISCVALIVVSWVASFSLIVYYLVVLAVTFEHAKDNPKVWDAWPMEHPWFNRSQPAPVAPLRHFSITGPLSLRTLPSIVDHRRQRSSWLPSPLEIPRPVEPDGSQRFSLHSARASVKSLFVPKWAKDLRPVQRGVQLPFPVQTRAEARRWEDPRQIDAPVSPSVYTEYT